MSVRIIVIVRDGLVQSAVSSDAETELDVLDYDNWEATEEKGDSKMIEYFQALSMETKKMVAIY